MNPADAPAVFRRLHESGCFVIPNPWDLGSARLLAGLGFRRSPPPAPGSPGRSGGPTTASSLDEALAHLRAIATAVERAGERRLRGRLRGRAGRRRRERRRWRSATGVAGLSIEDSTGDAAHPLFDVRRSPSSGSGRRGARSTQRHAACCSPADPKASSSAAPTSPRRSARLHGLRGGRAPTACTRPGIRNRRAIAAVVEAVAPKPVNVLVGSDFTTVAELGGAGRAAHQRRRRAGAGRVGRLPAGGQGDRRTGHASRIWREAVPFSEIDRSFA